MSQDVVVHQDELTGDRWEKVYCPQCNARLCDIDRRRRVVGVRCRKCHQVHAEPIDRE